MRPPAGNPPRSATTALLLALAGALPSPVAAQQVPPTWRHRLDAPAAVVAASRTPRDSVVFVTMAPGFHITTGPGALLWEPSVRPDGAWALESDGFTFPGTSQAGLGIFFGATDLDGTRPEWTAFLIRRDGAAAVVDATDRALVPWRVHPAVHPQVGDAVVRNALRVTTSPDSVRFFANGTALFALPRTSVRTDGGAGLRIGADMNVHVTTWDHTRRLAPVPPPRPAAPAPPGASGQP